MKEWNKKYLIHILILSIVVLSSVVKVKAQTNQTNKFRILFYNVENYFDTENDSLTNDDDFTPTGSYYWTYKKFHQKTSNIFKAIASVCGIKKPDIIAVCEIENRFVLSYLLKNTPLKESGYKIVHHESEDRRGIDVGLLYNENSIWPLHNQKIKITFHNQPQKRTRDILYFKGLLKNRDTLHIFVNHWPSKYGGAIATIPFRAEAAKTLKKYTDSIYAIDKNANIVITGDLNDEPHEESVSKHLNAGPVNGNQYLVNLSLGKENSMKGTHRYNGQWSVLDQFIISRNLLDSTRTTYTTPSSYKIGNTNILLEEDTKYTGKKPFRTYIGYKYNGGFSDHLPVYLDLIVK